MLAKLSRNYLQLPIAALVDEYAKRFKRDTAPSASWKGGRFAHQRPHSIMDNADNVGVGYLNNAPIPHLAFVLPSVGCSVSVAGSDTGPKILGIIVGRRNPPHVLCVKIHKARPVHPIHFASVAERGERNGRTKRLEELVA